MTQPPPLIKALRRLAGPRPDDRTDAELLARFVATRDPDAFAALVHRHGRVVWGACRRRTRDAHAAEDAFQTTFLALARNAASVRRPAAVGAWLHRVACRCTAALRTPREPMSALPPDVPTRGAGPAAAAEGRDLERVIDAEIDALPEPFRLAFVLCEVEERTAADAAAVLGCAVGTVESRLTRARERLRARLAKRGVTVGALVGLGLAVDAVPATAKTAAVALGTGAAPVGFARAALADQAARGPLLGGASGFGAGLAGAVLLVGVGGLLWTIGKPADPAGSGPAARSLPVPDLQVPEPEQFRRNRQNFPLPPEAIARIGDPWLRHAGSPDRLAFSQDGRFLATGADGDRWLRIWDLSAGRPRTHLSLAAGETPVALALTADGGTLRAVIRAGTDTTQLRQYDTFRGIETHRRPIPTPVAAVFSPAGGQLALTRAGEVRVFDAATALEQWHAELPGATSVEAAFVGRDRLAVLRTEADRVRLFDLATGKPADELVEPGAKMTFPAVSGDGRTMAVWLPLRNHVRVWDLKDRRIVHTFEPAFPPRALDVSPDGSQVAVFTDWRGADLYAARATGQPRKVPGTGGEAGRYSPDGSVLAVASSECGVVDLVDPKTALPVPYSPGESLGLLPVAFRADGRLLLQGWMHWLDCPTAGDDPPRVVSPGPAPGEKCTLPAADRAALSPDRTLMARVAAVPGQERAFVIEVVDAATGAPRSRIPVADRRPFRPAFSPDNKTVYAILGKHVAGWDVASGHEVMRGKTPAGELVYRLIVSPDGRHLATALNVLVDAQRDRSIQVWDAATGESLFAAEAGHMKPFIAFSADGRRFAAAAVPEHPAQHPAEVRVWDVDARRLTAAFPGYDGQPAFSPDGRTLAVTRDDHVALLELASGQVRHVFQHHGAVKPALAWRADGRVLAAASPEAPVYLWDVFGDRTGAVAPWDPARHGRRLEALAGRAADAAFAAVRDLWAHPAEAAEFLRTYVAADADARLACRACEALEVPGAAVGRRLLAEWAAGPADAPRTREARAALGRLGVPEGGGRG